MRCCYRLDRKYLTCHSSIDSQTIEQFAILEFRHGDQERGKTIFEGLVDRYPKRLDLWNVYIDQVAKLGDVQAARYVLYDPVSARRLPN